MEGWAGKSCERKVLCPGLTAKTGSVAGKQNMMMKQNNIFLYVTVLSTRQGRERESEMKWPCGKVWYCLFDTVGNGECAKNSATVVSARPPMPLLCLDSGYGRGVVEQAATLETASKSWCGVWNETRDMHIPKTKVSGHIRRVSNRNTNVYIHIYIHTYTSFFVQNFTSDRSTFYRDTCHVVFDQKTINLFFHSHL